MNKPIIRTISILAGLFLAGGCAAPVDKPESTGFLSDYSKLELKEDGHLAYLGDRAGEYNSFMIDPVSILFERNVEDPVFSDKEIEELKQYVVDNLKDDLTKDDGYSVVNTAGPGVARIRVGITELDETIGVLNVSTYTKITGAGLGGVSAEGELVDSVSGEQLGAMVRWDSGNRIGRAGYTHMGDAKIAINHWSKELRKVFDEVHGR